ncbi:MAG: FimV/HubP family polar landmark protein [Pseudohongiellaceae bacterium]
MLDIAQQVRPVASVTLQQTMLAIQALNPDAFIDDNINRMRSGQVLRVPNREEIEATDTSTAASEVARQNQAFADLQPLAAPAQDEPDTQAAPQDQLSVITAEDAAFDATSGAGELDDEQNAELDRRIAELENQLALRQEEADRARIEREELDSRLADLEAQIEAAQGIIRLQDMQLAQLQESLAEAAAEAEVVAAEEAALAAAQAEIAAAQAQPATGANLTDNIMRILTGNTIIIPFGVALVILLLVGLLLRRNRTVADDEEDELGGLDQQDFDADREQGAAADAGFEQAIENKAEADENDLDQELEDILGSGSSETEMLIETGDSAETEKGLVAKANALIQQQKYGQAASALRQALEADPADHDARLKLAEALVLQDDLAAFEEQADIIAEERSPILDREVSNLREKLSTSSAATASEAPGAEESEDDAGFDFEGFGDVEDAAKKSAEEPAVSPEERQQDDDTASFLDDLGVDLDAFDADDFEFSDEFAEADDDSDQPAPDETDDNEPSLDAELDMAFDLGAIADLEDSEEQQEEQQIDELLDEQSDSTKPEDLKTDDEIFILDESDEGIDGAASDQADDETIIEFDEESSEEQEAQESDAQFDKSESLEKDDDTVLDLDAKSENAELTSGSAKEVDDLDIDAFEFDAGDFKTEDNSGEDSQAATKEDKLDLETFSFDTEDIPKPAPTAETEPLVADDENALDFDFDKAEIKRDSDADSTDEPEEIETFEFDGEPAESESNIDGSATADESDATEVDIDEVSFDIGEEIEAEEGREAGSAANSDDDEFDFDLDAEPEASAGSGDPVEEEGSEVELLFDDESDSSENTESGTETSVSADQDIEIDLDFDESPEVEGVAEKTEDAEEDDLGDLGFLSDDDEVEIESVDGVEEVSLMSDDDETATKLELAYAYQKMGDADGAREILQEVIAEGNEAQVKEAGELLVTLDDAD